jgi:CubicO group peptidase (beta-lactamase class C family)
LPVVTATNLRADTVRELDDLLTSEQVEAKLPTLVAGLVRDGELVWSGERGTTGVRDDSSGATDRQYRIGSISKTFVAVAVMRLRNEGAFELNDGIGEHIPELRDLPVTVAQLLSHTSGLPAETTGPWWERTPGSPFTDLLSTALRKESLLTRPGSRFHYSNLGYAVLGELIVRKRAAPFGEVLSKDLWEPLGMRRTSLRPVAPYVEGLAVHPHAPAVLVEPEFDAVAMAPAGQLWSTVEDLARWSGLISGRHEDILGHASLAEMTQPIGVMDIPGEPWDGAYGLGLQQWNDAGRRLYGHLGAMPGYWAVVLVDKGTNDAVVAVANSTYRGLRVPFFDDLLKAFGADRPTRAEPFGLSQAAVDPEVLELLGAWYFGPVEVRIAAGQAGKLELRGVRGPGRDCDFRPNGDGTYTGEYGYYEGERLVPVRTVDGSLSHLDIASFIYTRVPYDAAAFVPGGVDERGWLGSWPPA